jgi:hypothetical protein
VLRIDQAETIEIVAPAKARVCEMSWTGDAFRLLKAAFDGSRPVQLGVVHGGQSVSFKVYIDGVRQMPGGGFQMDYVMRDA